MLKIDQQPVNTFSSDIFRSLVLYLPLETDQIKMLETRHKGEARKLDEQRQDRLYQPSGKFPLISAVAILEELLLHAFVDLGALRDQLITKHQISPSHFEESQKRIIDYLIDVVKCPDCIGESDSLTR